MTGRRGRKHGQEGATVLELVVSLGVMAVVLSIATQVFIVSQTRMARAGRGMGTVSIDLALARLRHDVRDARAVLAPANGLWSSDALVLDPVAGPRLRWLLDDETLVRVRATDAGQPEQRTVMLDGVLTFRWRRSLAPHRPLLDIDLVDRGGRPRVGTASPKTGLPAAPVLRRRALRLTVRGGGGRHW